MLRISKLTDYAVVVAVELAHIVPARRALAGAKAWALMSAAQVAERTGVPEPTVAKVLKRLAHAGLVASQRGVTGGYGLAQPAETISVASIIEAIEGPIALTQCADAQDVDACVHAGQCEVQPHWQRISAAVRHALASLSLADMAAPASPLVGLGRKSAWTEMRG